MQSIHIILIADGFAVNDLKIATLVSTLRDKKKEYTLILIKSIDIIKKLVDKSLYPLFDNKSTAEI